MMELAIVLSIVGAVVVLALIVWAVGRLRRIK
jgi:hypothetical protein